MRILHKSQKYLFLQFLLRTFISTANFIMNIEQRKTSFWNSNLQLYNSRSHGGFWTSSQFIFFFPSTRLVFSSTRTEGSCACNDLIWFLLPRHQIWRLAYTKITYFLVENEHFSTVEKVSTYLQSNTNNLPSFVIILLV